MLLTPPLIVATAAADPPRTCSTPWPRTPGSPPSWLQSRPQGSQSRRSATSDLSLSSLPPTTPSPRSPATPWLASLETSPPSLRSSSDTSCLARPSSSTAAPRASTTPAVASWRSTGTRWPPVLLLLGSSASLSPLTAECMPSILWSNHYYEYKFVKYRKEKCQSLLPSLYGAQVLTHNVKILLWATFLSFSITCWDFFWKRRSREEAFLYNANAIQCIEDQMTNYDSHTTCSRNKSK